MTLFLSGKGIHVVLARGYDLRLGLCARQYAIGVTAFLLLLCLPFQAILSQPTPVPHSGDKRRQIKEGLLRSP